MNRKWHIDADLFDSYFLSAIWLTQGQYGSLLRGKPQSLDVNLGLNYSFAPKGDFSEKIDHHSLCLYSRHHYPTKFQANVRLQNFG